MWKRFFSAPEIAAGNSRWGVFCRGLLVLLTGILIAFQPLLATFTLAVMFGWGLFLWGVWIVVGALQLKKRKWAWILYGTMLSLGGILLLVNPEAELLAFAWSVAVLLLSGGIISVSICLAANDSSMQNIFCFTASIFSILLGSLLFLCPVSGMTELFWFLGLLLAAEGVVLMIFSFRIPRGKSIADDGT
ncbi:MAG: DUF308 domain-containing protein, partial [Lentisphaeria bacterium]|nr:DUF308 domain-containing protein [Lentisphaeria bacterium]